MRQWYKVVRRIVAKEEVQVLADSPEQAITEAECRHSDDWRQQEGSCASPNNWKAEGTGEYE